jgi:hypothetical protein
VQTAIPDLHERQARNARTESLPKPSCQRTLREIGSGLQPFEYDVSRKNIARHENRQKSAREFLIALGAPCDFEHISIGRAPDFWPFISKWREFYKSFENPASMIESSMSVYLVRNPDAWVPIVYRAEHEWYSGVGHVCQENSVRLEIRVKFDKKLEFHHNLLNCSKK